MIRKAQIIQITLFLVCLLNSIRAVSNEQESYIFSKIDYQQGLSNSAVICIFKDSSELMWFGTYDGVNCFDGKGMEVFRSDFSKNKTFDNNVIHGIQQADSNCLWISTYLGVNRFSLDSRQVVANYDFSRDCHLSSNSKGDTWVIGDDQISYYNTSLSRFIPLIYPDITVNDPKTHSFVTEEGDLWVFPESEGELYRFSLNGFDRDTLATKVNISSSRFHSKPIEYIFYQDKVAFCFIDSDMDLYMYYIARQNKVYIRNMASLIEEYGNIVGVVPFYDDIIVAFKTNGLIRLRTSEKYEYDIIDQSVRVFDIYKDPEQGILWIGSDGQGAIMYARKNAIATNLMMHSFSSNFSRQVRTIVTDPYGGLWFGTKGDGLLHIKEYEKGISPEKAILYFPEKKQSAGVYTKENTEFQVYGLKQSRYMDGFWMGSSNSELYYYSFKDDRVQQVTDTPGNNPYGEIHSIHEENDSVLYLATSGGGLRKIILDKQPGNIRMKEEKSYHFFYQQQEISMFYSMISDGDSLLWLGSREKGLIRFDKKAEEYQVVSLKERLNKTVDDVLCIHYMENGQMYVGTTSGLVSLTFQGRRIQAQYTGREQGLLNDMIHGILEDANGFLWLSTNKGLIKYNPLNGSSHAYYYTGGVQIGEFSDGAYYTCPYTNRLFFGGIDGLLYLNKEVTTGPDYYPDILLRKLMIGRTEVNITDYYTKDRAALQFQDSPDSFTLKFVAPDYITGADMEYSYMLEGYEDEWKPFSSINEAIYTNVPVGKYIFKVRYKKDLFDSEFKSFSIPVYILPVWYQTITAYLIYILLCLLFLLYVFYLLRKYIHHKQIVKKLLEAESRDTCIRTGNQNQELMDSFLLIYRICDQLRAENTTYEQRCQKIELIRENIMSLLFGSDIFQTEESKKFSPVHFSISGRLCLKELSTEVLGILQEKGISTDLICVEIPDDFSFPVYKNALRYILYYIYLLVSGSKHKTDFIVNVAEEEGYMLLTFASRENLLNELKNTLTNKNDVLLEQIKQVDKAFERRMLHRFVHSALEQLNCSVEYIETGQGASVVLKLPTAVPEELNGEKKIILLLEDRDEMVWFFRDMLVEEYTIQQVKSVQLAFEYIKKTPPALFLVDMMMYADAEATFMELIKKNGSLLEKTAFIPMLTWEASSTIQRELILWSDSYIVLPYDILFVKETIHKAIYGKKEPKQIYVDGLDNFAHLITCTNNDQVGFIKKMMEVIERNLDREDLGSSFIAEQMAMSPRKFYRKFKEISDMSPTDLIKDYRMEKAALLLLNSELSIQEVIVDVGISSRSYFYKEFTRKFGVTPKDYREQNKVV